MKKEDIISAFFFGLLAVILYQLFKIFAPFLTLFLIASILAITFLPIQMGLKKRLGRFPTLVSFISTACVTVLVIAPLLLWIFLLGREAVDSYALIRRTVREVNFATLQQSLGNLPLPPAVQESLNKIGVAQPDLPKIVLRAVNTGSRFLVTQLASLTKNVFLFCFNVLFIILILFFLFRNGESWYRFVYDLIPMKDKDKEFLAAKLYHSINAVVRGVFLTAAIQGVMAAITLWLLGVPFAPLWGFLTVVLALIPIIGAAGVWFPITLYLFFNHLWVKALILLIVGFFGISLADNLLRPLLIGERAKLPFLFLFLGILGGFLTYGSIGILLGPLLISILLALAQIYREQYH
jgi:predicted PurR-regulated permease PerM